MRIFQPLAELVRVLDRQHPAAHLVQLVFQVLHARAQQFDFLSINLLAVDPIGDCHDQGAKQKYRRYENDSDDSYDPNRVVHSSYAGSPRTYVRE